MSDPTVIDTYLGNAKWVKFRMRRKNQVGYYNAATASRIMLEVARVGDLAPLSPIPCVSTAPGADWTTGLIPALLSAGNVTSRVGTYKYTLTVTEAPYEDTVDSGFIEVRDRPITSYALPGGGGNEFTSTNVNYGVNAGLNIIKAGMPITRVAGGVDTAIASPPLTPLGDPTYRIADGVAIADCIPGAMCLYISNGSLRLTDWTEAFGVPTLPLASSIYLDNAAGEITTTVPTSPDFGLLQVVGETQDNGNTLYITLGYTVAL